ncbi:sensor histidine kinase [Microlunatus capsulatus]|uniref:histidine kinase n=1 Tax=Microlunatus capsulatus TaxID=99117 RepID=A0ABS4ZCI3_9ACTN|nr:ATP-binding protein [Microlunatus capsulatus]MBP2418779.1 two-component system NarL family sensor kinase [Microlunatus capsulatus]
MSLPAAPLAAGAGLQSLTTGSARVTALLRLPLVGLALLVGPVVDEPALARTPYLAVLGAFAGWALLVLVWSFGRPAPRWAGPLTTVVDLTAVVTLAALSGGATSYLTPIFYAYPVLVVFQYRPLLSGVVSGSIALAYLAVWLENLGRSGGPSLPGVVWLHFGLLSWLALCSTALTVVLTRRSRAAVDLLTLQQRVTAESLAAVQRHDAALAEQLHDGPLQELIAVRRNLEQLDETDGTPGLRAQLVAQSDDLLRSTIRSLRGTVTSLHPQVLAQLGLAPALRELGGQVARRSGLRVHVDAVDAGAPGTTPTEEALVYGAARELLGNVEKHAHAGEVHVRLSRHPAGLRLEVQDDGVGLSPTATRDKVATGHIGLASYTTRLAASGGRLVVGTAPGGGTRAVVTLPSPAGSARAQGRSAPLRSSAGSSSSAE